MKYIVYIRVSTENQGEHGLGSEAQLHACNEWIKKNHKESETLDVRVFKDVVTGTDKEDQALEDRPKLVTALTEVEKGDILITLKRDRIARNPFVIELIERNLRKKGAQLKCANGEGEGNEPHEVLMRRIIDAFAEHEGLMISKRISLAMKRKKANNERMGHIPYGYMLNASKILVVNPEEAAILETMYNYRMINKMNFRDIATKLNEQGFRNRPNKNSNGSPWTHGATSRVYKNYPTLKSSTIAV